MAGTGEPGSSHKPGDTREGNFPSERESSLGGSEDRLNASVNKDDPILQSNHTIFLGHRGMQKDFVMDIDLDSDSRKLMKGALSNLQHAWEIIESISEISSSVLVNKIECELIAIHFSHVAKALEDQGLDKGFAGCKVLDGGVMRVSFTKREPPEFSNSEFAWSRFFGEELESEYVRYRHKKNLDKKFLLSSFSHGSEHRTLHFLLENTSRPEQELAEFIGDLLKMLTAGRDLVSIHQGLNEVNNEIVLKTGLRGKEFVRVHVALDKLLRLHSEQPLTSYLSRPDYDRMFIRYLNSNCLGDQEDLQIDFETSSNVELAIALAKVLERPDSVLKGLAMIQRRRSEEFGSYKSMECRRTVIEALSKSTKLIRLSIEKATEEEVHELCKILAANKVLEELCLEFNAHRVDGSVGKLFALLKSNQSVKSLTLKFDGEISKEGAACVGSMLVENSTLEGLVLDFSSCRYSDKPYLSRMIRPLVGSDDGESPLNTFLHSLTIFCFRRYSSKAVAAFARMLRTNKSLLSFRLPFYFPVNDLKKSSLSFHLPNYYPDDCLTNSILKSLENNKTLQELELVLPSDDNEDSMIRLLVEHNFTLKTIWCYGRPYSTENFIKYVLEKWNSNAFRGLAKIPSNMVTRYQMQPRSKSISSSNSMLSHDIFLSYSEDGRDFAKQLYMKLRASKYNVLNNLDSSIGAKEELSTTSDQCQLAIVVLSESYVTSKQSMLELSRFMKMKNTCDSTLKMLLLFYKLTVHDLNSEEMEFKWADSWKKLIKDGVVQKEEIGLWNEIVKVIFEEKNAQLVQAKALLRDLMQCKIDAEAFCAQFNGVCNVLDLKNYDNSEAEYLLAVVEEIKNTIHPIMKSEIDQILGYLSMFEMHCELSLQRMISMLKEDPLLANQFLLQRALNKGDYLQQKYIEWKAFGAKDNFQEMDEKYGNGCITASLSPKAFLYHFKAQVLWGALYKASTFDDNSCLPMLLNAAIAIANNWRVPCGLDDQTCYNSVAEEILKTRNISKVSSMDNGDVAHILCCYNANNYALEFYFKDHKVMARIVGVGLDYAKAILMKGGIVKVEETLKVDWDMAWKEVKSNPNTLSKLLKLESCPLNEEEEMISKEKIPPKLLIWELAKYFILSKHYDMLSSAPRVVKNDTNSGESNSNSQNSSGNDNNQSNLGAGFFRLSGNWKSTNNGNKDQDRENCKDRKDDEGDEKKEKSLENLDPIDVIDNIEDTTVIVELLPGGDILVVNNPSQTSDLELSTLKETIIPTMEFTFINRKESKKIQTTVGEIVFKLDSQERYVRKRVEWIHTEIDIRFVLSGEEHQRKGELVRGSFNHLDLREGKQSTKTIKTAEEKRGKENGIQLEMKGAPHGVGLRGQYGWKSTNSNDSSEQFESNYERSDDRTEGGFLFDDHIDGKRHYIGCTYRVPSNELHLAEKTQTCKLQCTWVALDVGEHGSAEIFVPYTFIATRILQKNVPKERRNEERLQNLSLGGIAKNLFRRKDRNDKGTQQELPTEYVQEYERVLYINHAMTHLDGKLHTIKERGGEPGKSTFFSSETSLTKEYDWGNCPPLVKLPESQTSSTVGASNDASTSSSGRQPQQI